jgi:hypothetical protein
MEKSPPLPAIVDRLKMFGTMRMLSLQTNAEAMRILQAI